MSNLKEFYRVDELKSEIIQLKDEIVQLKKQLVTVEKVHKAILEENYKEKEND